MKRQMCECERSGHECAVRVYVGEPGLGYWACQRDKAITEYYRDRANSGNSPLMGMTK